MKHLALLPLAFAAVAIAQDTPQREDYKAICKTKPPQTSKTFDDGYEITYICDAAGSLDAELPGTGETAESSDDCAMRCKTTKGCKASDWFYSTQVCNLYSDEAVGDEVLGSVLMQRVTPEEDSESVTLPSGGDCEKKLQTCLAQNDDLSDDLKECKEKAEKDAEVCAEKLKEAQDKLEACQKKVESCKLDPVWERRRQAMEICGYGGRKKIQAGKYAYTAHCQRMVAPSAQFYRQAALSVDACLAECSKDPKCKAIHYVIMNDAHCKFLPVGKTTALAVDSESTCPKSPMIGFAPTTAK